MISNVKSHIAEIAGATVAGGSASVSLWQLQVQWGISVTAGLVAIVAGALTIRSLLRKNPTA